MNNVSLIGNITRDIELRKTTQNTSFVKFSLAVNGGKSKDGKDITDFIPCQAWKGTADLLEKYTKKGSKIGVNGKFKSNTYEYKGEKRYEYYCLVESIDLLSSAKENNQETNTQVQQEAPKEVEDNSEKYYQSTLNGNDLDATGFKTSDFNPDDLPFY